MIRRLILSLIVTALPLAALADTTTPTPTPASTAQGSSDSSLLGPQSTNSGSTTADGGTLQPAGVAPLQASVDSSDGLTAPTDSLQASTNDGQLTVLAGEADGSPHDPGSGTGWPIRLVVVVVVIALLLGVAELGRRRLIHR